MRICKFKCTNCLRGKKYPCAVAIAEPTDTEEGVGVEKTLNSPCLVGLLTVTPKWELIGIKYPMVKDKARTKPMGRLEFYRKELHKFSSQLQPHMLEGGFIARAYREYLNSFREKNV
jgi:hypothetical protein